MKNLTLATALLVIVSCSGDVREQDLIGHWSAIRETLPAEHVSEGLGTPRLELRERGSFDAIGLYGVAGAVDEVRRADGSGTWRIAAVDGRAIVLLSFDRLDGRRLKQEYGFPLDIESQRSGFALTYSVGDPDNGDVVEFRKDASPRRTPSP